MEPAVPSVMMRVASLAAEADKRIETSPAGFWQFAAVTGGGSMNGAYGLK